MSKLLQSLNNLRLKDLYCDVLVRGGDGKDQSAHRVVLAAVSPVFDRELTAHANMKQPPVILLNGFNSELIGKLLDWIYCQHLTETTCPINLITLCKLLEIEAENLVRKHEHVESNNDAKTSVTENHFYKKKRLKIQLSKIHFHNKTQSTNKSPLNFPSAIKTPPIQPTPSIAIKQEHPQKTSPASTLPIPGEQQHHCFLCKQTYSTAGNLKRHYLTVHQKIKPYACEICHKRYGQKVTLQIHMKTTHLFDSTDDLTFNSSSDPHLLGNHGDLNDVSASIENSSNENNNDITESVENNLLNNNIDNLSDSNTSNNTSLYSNTTNTHNNNYNNINNNNNHINDINDRNKKVCMEVLKGCKLNLNSTCHICHKKLSRPSNLKKHLLIHYSTHSYGDNEAGGDKGVIDNGGIANINTCNISNGDNSDVSTVDVSDNACFKSNCDDNDIIHKGGDNVAQSLDGREIGDDEQNEMSLNDDSENLIDDLVPNDHYGNSSDSYNGSNRNEDANQQNHQKKDSTFIPAISTTVMPPPATTHPQDSTSLNTPTSLTPILSRTLSFYPSITNHHNTFSIGPRKKFICEACGKSFALAEYLKKHLLSVHNTVSFGCSECKRRFSTGALVKRHKRVHERRSCHGCQGEFEGRRALSSHLRTSSCSQDFFGSQDNLGLL